MNILIGIIAVLLAALLWQEFSHRMKALEIRIARLEESKQKKINYESMEEMDNAFAALVIVESVLEIIQKALENLRAHMTRARNPKGTK